MSEAQLAGVQQPVRRRWGGMRKIGFVLLCAIVVGLILLIVNYISGHRPPPPKPEAQQSGFGSTGSSMEEPGSAPVDHTAAKTFPPPPAAQPSIMQQFAPRLSETPEQQAIKSPIFAAGVNGAEVSAGATANAKGKPAAAEKDGNGALNRELKASSFAAAYASVIRHPDFLIGKGTIIKCGNAFAVDTSLPGIIKCVTRQPVMGMTGRIALLPKGTTITGDIHTLSQQGMTRAFITWTDAETPAPRRVQIKLDSPGADALGRAGIPGHVENHWWERIGNAALFTMIGGGFQTASSALSNNAFIEQAQGTGNSVASVALQNSINIPPTLTLPQGATVAIVVARRLDFSRVYRLEMAR